MTDTKSQASGAGTKSQSRSSQGGHTLTQEDRRKGGQHSHHSQGQQGQNHGSR